MKLNCSKFEFVFFSCGSVSIVCFFLFLLCSMVSHGNLLSNTDYEYQDLYSNPRVNVIRPQPPPDFDNEFDNDIFRGKSTKHQPKFKVILLMYITLALKCLFSIQIRYRRIDYRRRSDRPFFDGSETLV